VRKAFQRLAFLPTSVALAATFFAGSMLMQVPSVRAAAAADADSREVTRLINVARTAVGKHALNVDVFLASKARDGSIPCPDDPDKTISGRAKDFSTYGKMDHKLRLCDADGYALSTTSFVSTLQNAWGYGAVGEILLVNGGYGQGQFLYTYKGVSTWTYATTGHAMLGWATSPSHWNIVMGSYDRVGCGAWTPGGTTIWYACLFAGGGPAPSGVTAPPTKSPFNDPLPPSAATPVPTATPKPATPKPATPKPATPKPVVTPKPVATSQAGGGAIAASSDAPSAGPSASAGLAATTQEPSVAPVMDVEAATLLPSEVMSPEAAVVPAEPSDPPTTEPVGAVSTNNGTPASPGRSQALTIASAAAAWLGLFALLLIQRRRRLRHLPAPAA
jgi:hypothetical protein